MWWGVVVGGGGGSLAVAAAASLLRPLRPQAASVGAGEGWGLMGGGEGGEEEGQWRG